MITQEEVQHIAKLARLGLTQKEIRKYQNDLSAILDYIKKLKEVDISEVEPMSHSIAEPQSGLVRNDLPAKIFKENLNGREKNLLKLAPEIKGDYLKVKSILK